MFPSGAVVTEELAAPGRSTNLRPHASPYTFLNALANLRCSPPLNPRNRRPAASTGCVSMKVCIGVLADAPPISREFAVTVASYQRNVARGHGRQTQRRIAQRSAPWPASLGCDRDLRHRDRFRLATVVGQGTLTVRAMLRAPEDLLVERTTLFGFSILVLEPIPARHRIFAGCWKAQEQRSSRRPVASRLFLSFRKGKFPPQSWTTTRARQTIMP